jgi:hypothetical protein
VRRIAYGRNLGFLDRTSLEHSHKALHGDLFFITGMFPVWDAECPRDKSANCYCHYRKYELSFFSLYEGRVVHENQS